uniref:Uncharacterized protein n=1 Tax=Arundo donax TaxID=35708 RepID=A0A0A8ZPX5_ARUDO
MNTVVSGGGLSELRFGVADFALVLVCFQA